MSISQEEFDAAVDAIDVINAAPEQVLRTVAERFPQMTQGEFGALMERFLALQDARLARTRRQIDAATAVIDALDGEPASASVGVATERRASAGDPAAKALLAHFESPAFRLQGALLDAAVEAHPDWHVVGHGRYRHQPPEGTPKADPTEAPDKLVEWFIETHPAEASAIAERITGEKQPEVRP